MKSVGAHGVGIGRALLALTLAAASVLAGCAAEATDEDTTGTGDDALTQGECTKIVEKSVTAAKKRCDAVATEANDKVSQRRALESAIVKAVGSFTTELGSYEGQGRATVDAAVRECSAMACSGELRRDDVKAECNVEKSLLQGACYVRHLPAIRAAATDLDFSQEIGSLESSVDAMQDQWAPLAAQEAWLRTQHTACAGYVGSSLQRSSINAQCRASCNASDPTNAFAKGGGSCSPAGYEQVKDDLGRIVTCGTTQRPIQNLGSVCECRETRECTQWASLAGSSERGKSCGAGKTKKIVWDAKERVATLECR